MPGVHNQTYICAEDGFRVGNKASNTEVITKDREIKNVESIDAKNINIEEINDRNYFHIFDDFIYQTIAESDTPWVLNSGTEGDANDPAINAQAGGVIRCDPGTGTGVVAEDASQLSCHLPMKAESGGLVFEARLKIVANIANAKVCLGFGDTTNRESPFHFSGVTTVASNASDGAAFLYDVAATEEKWWTLAVANDSDSDDNASSGVVPVKDVYQVFRIEIEEDASAARFYIDGELVATITDDVPRKDQDLHATVIAWGDGSASRKVDVDYIYIGHLR